MYFDTFQESLIDASEDSQLEAAIRASLQETHFDSTSTKQTSQYEEESDPELYSGSEEFISVCGSDHEDEDGPPVETLPEPETCSSKAKKATSKNANHRREEQSEPVEDATVEADFPSQQAHLEKPPKSPTESCLEDSRNPDHAEDCADNNGEYCTPLLVKSDFLLGSCWYAVAMD